MMLRLAAQIWGRGRNTLAPSVTAIGPNTYLTGRDFMKVLGVALAVHVLAFVVASLLPDNRVTHIPVRALSFKLGGAVPAAAPVARPATPPAPVMQASAPSQTQTWQAKPNEAKPVTPPPLKPVAKPVAPAEKPVAAQPQKQPKVYKVEEPPKPADQLPPMQPQTAKQYVREVGAAPAQQATAPAPPAATTGSVTVNEAVIQALRTKYEQEISGWIQRHKFYPVEAGGKEGRVVVRMRIDRQGNVRYYAIEQSSGLTALDAAALDMIRRANPVPAVPESYPAGNLVEFLIPISFKAPQ